MALRSLGLGVAIAVMVGGCLGHAEGRLVALGDDFFEPTEIRDAVNQTFRFKNEGARAHTVTIQLNSSTVVDKVLEPGDSHRWQVATTGHYHFFCRYHGAPGSGMHANAIIAESVDRGG